MARKPKPNTIVGGNLAAMRTRAKRTQKALAAVLGLCRESVTEIEAGRRKLSLPEAYAASCFLGGSLARLTKGLPVRTV